MSGVDEAASVPAAEDVDATSEVESRRDDLAVFTSGLCKRYGRVAAVDGLDLEVPVGSIYGLIGPNGAGKTTTFAILATLLKQTSGTARIFGIDPASAPRQVRTVMGYMPDGLGVYGNLTIDEYLRFFAGAYQIPRQRLDGLVDGLLELVALTGRRDSRVDSLSRGMKQRLSLARALIHDPKLLILDEPASGLDPRARSELGALLTQLVSMGKTILVSSHILAELEQMCTHIGIIQDGSLLAHGATDEISGQLNAARRVKARFADGSVEERDVADETEQAAVLRELAADPTRSLLEFTRVGGGLEELFLSLTKRIDE